MVQLKAVPNTYFFISLARSLPILLQKVLPVPVSQTIRRKWLYPLNDQQYERYRRVFFARDDASGLTAEVHTMSVTSEFLCPQ